MKEKTMIELINLVIELRGKYEKPLGPETKLYEDLGMDGDDADEFIQEYIKKFDVDMSEFHFEHYFNLEGFSLFSIIKSIFVQAPPLKSVSLGDLEKSAIKGKWIG